MRRYHKSFWANFKLSLIFSSLFGIIFLMVGVFFISGFAFFFISDFRLLRLLSLIPVFAGAFAGAYICGKYRRSKGMLSGIVCGIIIYVFISAAGIITAGRPAHIGKLLLLAIAGAIGGVAGVNSKRPKKHTL